MNGYSEVLDTIAAVSTPRGKGGIAVIRISGPQAADIAGRVFISKSGKKLTERPRSAFYGEIREPIENGSLIDTGLAVFFPGPGSFTGEDTVEISCHGGVLVTSAVLRAALNAGARQAEAGEFTRRSFASGKMSLPEAEALGLLLDAGTENQLRLSRAGLSGTLAGRCAGLRDSITGLLTDIYARIDFPEEDLGSIPDGEIADRLAQIRQETERLCGTYRTGRAVAEGIDTVICGRTNAGKSTLFNLMTGSDDAIVTDIEGTTRDILTSVVSFGGATLRLCDTAGIRGETDDKVEAIGIGRANKKIDSAELVLFLIDGSRRPDDQDTGLAQRLLNHPGQVIAVMTKTDLPKNAETDALFSRFENRVTVSARTPDGIGALERLVADMFIDGQLDIGTDPVVSSARQYTALCEALSGIDAAIDAMNSGFAHDVVSVCLEDAAAAFAGLDGRGFGAVSADVIDGIFSKFCVGK